MVTIKRRRFSFTDFNTMTKTTMALTSWIANTIWISPNSLWELYLLTILRQLNNANYKYFFIPDLIISITLKMAQCFVSLTCMSYMLFFVSFFFDFNVSFYIVYGTMISIVKDNNLLHEEIYIVWLIRKKRWTIILCFCIDLLMQSELPPSQRRGANTFIYSLFFD